MTRYLYALIALVCLTAVPAHAGENHNSDIGSSRSDLVKRSFRVGSVAVELFAQDRVDVVSLLADVDFSKAATAQSISDRVNERRKLLYPDAEIILSITPPQTGDGAENKAGLAKAIFWWNNTNCSTCYWYAQYTSTAATMFIDDVKYGSYNIYDKVGSSGSWVFRYLTGTGGASTRATYGSSTLRGFKGSAAGVSSQADIVMYFFN